MNGIDINIINELSKTVHNESRMVHTSRDVHFLDRSQKSLNFETKEASGHLSRLMLLNPSLFSKDDLDSFEEKNTSAFEHILRE